MWKAVEDETDQARIEKTEGEGGEDAKEKKERV